MVTIIEATATSELANFGTADKGATVETAEAPFFLPGCCLDLAFSV